MKTTTAKDYVNETYQFGTCYIGNANIMGWSYIEKQINKIRKYVKKNGLPEIWFYHNEEENSWYTHSTVF